MAESITILLAAWVCVCVGLFATLSGRDAALVAIVGGWAFLPTGVYPADGFASPAGSGGSVHALVVPSAMLVNKASACAVGCLAGMILFDWPALRRVRPSWVDLPLALWCLVPFGSALANGLSLVEGLIQSRTLTLSWGVPYLLGRVYLGESEGLRRLAVALVAAGVAYLPLCLLEFVTGPALYTALYGPHPYQLEGATRLVGSRPLGFLEHGNQLGLWLAVSAVAAVWLWWAGRLPAFGRLAPGVIATALVTATLLAQSVGAIVLMGLALVPLAWLGRTARAGAARVSNNTPIIAFGLALVIMTVLAVWLAADPGKARAVARGSFSSVGKGSFTWRMARTEESFGRIALRPWLGWGRSDWSGAPEGRFVNPVNLPLWLLSTGMFGASGTLALLAIVTVPVVAALRRLPVGAWLSPSGSAVALIAVLVLVQLGDSLVNSTWLPPISAGLGGLNAWALRKTVVL